jgi:MFS-type transporter involved in bile tolerance (Atg22 family)
LAIGFMPSVRAVQSDLLAYSVARGMLEGNSMPLFCSVVPRNRWSTAYGLYNLAGTLAGSLGIFIVGLKKPSWGIGYTLSSMSILLFIGAIVMSIVMFRRLQLDISRQRERESADAVPQSSAQPAQGLSR